MMMLGKRMLGAVGIMSCFAACGGSPEQSALEQFFLASKTADPTTLALMSAVGPPVEAETWNVVEVSSRSKEPFGLSELRKDLEAAEKKRDAGVEERKKYFEANQDALEQVIPKLREDPDYKFRGKVGEVQEEWLRLQEERRETERIYQESKRAFDRESRLASRSVVRQVSLAGFEGEVEISEVLVHLKPKDGQELPFKATLRRYAVTDPEIGRLEPARWVIVDFEGMSEEARAARVAHTERGTIASEPEPVAEPTPVATVSDDASVPAAASPGRERSYTPRELRGLARVQILSPETKVAGGNVITTIQVRNVSRDWIARFTATEYWYDQQGNVVRTTSRTQQGRFMPGQVIEMELQTPRSENFYQNQFEFQHGNGEVNAAVVQSFSAGT